MQPRLEIVTPDFAQHPLDAEDLRSRVDKAVDDHLAHQADVLDEVGDDLAPLMDALADLLRGGKRLRPAFCYWGWRGAGGADAPSRSWPWPPRSSCSRPPR